MKKNIGTKIKALRQQKGYSQTHIADRLHITQPAYQKVESGETKLDVYRLIELAKILETDVRDFLVEDGKIINFNNDSSHSNGGLNYYYNADLKEANDKHFETLNKLIAHLTEENKTLKNQVSTLINKLE